MVGVECTLWELLHVHTCTCVNAHAVYTYIVHVHIHVRAAIMHVVHVRVQCLIAFSCSKLVAKAIFSDK